MKLFKVIFALVVEFIILYLMFAFSQWSMNAHDWGIYFRSVFSGVFLMIGFFIIMMITFCDD